MADHAASACPDCTSSTEKREIKPFYVSSGSDAEDRLAFFHILERLKVCLRPFFNLSSFLALVVLN